MIEIELALSIKLYIDSYYLSIKLLYNIDNSTLNPIQSPQKTKKIGWHTVNMLAINTNSDIKTVINTYIKTHQPIDYTVNMHKSYS